MISCRGFNEALNGFTDEGWSMMGNDGIDDVTILVNSSPEKLTGLNLSFANGFPAVSNAVLCAKASMLLQVSTLKIFKCSGWLMGTIDKKFIEFYISLLCLYNATLDL